MSVTKREERLNTKLQGKKVFVFPTWEREQQRLVVSSGGFVNRVGGTSLLNKKTNGCNEENEKNSIIMSDR